jgi:hypothetical protein
MGETPAELPFIGDQVVRLSHNQAARTGPRKGARRAPAVIQLSVPPVNPYFLETEPLQKFAARNVFRKHRAGKLVHPSPPLLLLTQRARRVRRRVRDNPASQCSPPCVAGFASPPM